MILLLTLVKAIAMKTEAQKLEARKVISRIATKAFRHEHFNEEPVTKVELIVLRTAEYFLTNTRLR